MKLIKDFNGTESDAAGHIDRGVLNACLNTLREFYTQGINGVRMEPDLQTLPIIVHGYDYTFPYPHLADDHRSPILTANNEWLGKAQDQRQLSVAAQAQRDLRWKAVSQLIDALSGMLRDRLMPM